MVEMVNRMTGTSMLVAEDRVPEYLQQGHALARKQVKEIKKVPEKAPEKAPVVEPEKKPEKAVEDQPKTVEQVDQVEKPVKAKLRLSERFSAAQLEAGNGLKLSGGNVVDVDFDPIGYGVLRLTGAKR